jgi:para-nitrobenzyl esterase
MRRIELAAALLLAVATGCGSETSEGSGSGAGPSTDPDVVVVNEGALRGENAGDLRIFRGIPYAAAPVGDARLRPPAPPPAYDGERDAAAFAPTCPQYDRPGGGLSPPTSTIVGDEDCLYLNVWAHSDEALRPVMVFIHGGAFVAGTGSDPLYEASKLARSGDVTVVTINYRLGALGFLASEALAAESGQDSAGNYGVLDQLAALEWVQNNIAAFGGDPNNVTVFGESAGGISICALLGSARSDGLLQRAVIQSGGGCGFFAGLRTAGPAGTPSGIARGEAILSEVGCTGADELSCLRSLPLDTIARAGQSAALLSNFAPVIDGAVVQANAIDAFNDGSRDLPLMIGSNADEATVFTTAVVINDQQQLEAALRQLTVLPTLGDPVVAMYPASDFASPKAAYDAFVADVTFVCPALAMADAAGAGAPAFSYHFTHLLDGSAAALGAFHGLELAYVFGNLETNLYTPVAGDEQVSAAMQQAWSSFARDGAPQMTPPWPAHQKGAPQIQPLAVTIETVSEIRQGRCTQLSALGLVPT